MAYVHENFRERFNAGEEAFQITEFIAQGGQAWVFEATDKQTNDQQVALKVFPGFVHGGGSIDVFEDEYRHLRALNHFTNVITVFGTKNFEDKGEVNPYLIMELAEDNLANVLKQGLPDSETAVGFLQGAMKGMRAAHDKGILHCDLKPSNLLIKDGTVKVADFGIAINRSQETHTVTHDAKGTALYMPVEQFHGKARKQSDVYAMGAIAYELFTGELPRKPEEPFPGPVQWFHAHDKLSVPYFAPRDKVGEAVQAVIHTALERNYKRRFGDMGELEEAFSAAAARGIAEEKKRQIIIDVKPVVRVRKEEPQAPPETRPYEKARDGDGTKPAEADNKAETKPENGHSRRTFLRAGLAGVAVAGGLFALSRVEQVEDWVKHNLGTPRDQVFAARIQLLESMFGKLTADDAKSSITSTLATNHGQEALSLLTHLQIPEDIGAVWPALALEFPGKTADAVRNFTARSQYNAATNAAMGLALHANSVALPKPDRQRSFDAIDDLVSTLIANVPDDREASTLLVASDQLTDTLPPSYQGKYTSKTLGERLVEYGKDPDYTYEFTRLVVASAAASAPALRQAAHSMFDYAKTVSPKDNAGITVLSNASSIASQLAKYSPEEGLVMVKRVLDEFPDTVHWAVAEIAPEIAANDPSGLQELLDAYPKDGTATFTQGAIAGYSPTHVDDLADRFPDGSANKAWLRVLASPTNHEYAEAALATMTNQDDAVTPNKVNRWSAFVIARMAMAATAYEKNAHYLFDR